MTGRRSRSRRSFLGTTSAAAFAAAALPGAASAIAGRREDTPSPSPRATGPNRPRQGGRQPGLNVLVLGGTGFIGPHLVRRLLERGHGVVLFNRGRTNTHLFPEVERLEQPRDRRGAGVSLPLAVTAKDTLDWHLARESNGQGALRTGLDRATEARLLEEWRRAVG